MTYVYNCRGLDGRGDYVLLQKTKRSFGVYHVLCGVMIFVSRPYYLA